MKKPIFTALSPNAQKDDIWLALKLLFMPWRWRSGKYVNLLRKKLSEWLPAEHVFLFESGRTSLMALLESLDLQQGDEVLLQAYTCVAVPEPVLWRGLKPVYVDCREEDLGMSVSDLEKKITPRSKALIIQHTFGYPADVDALLAVARKHGLLVIEDCAHALGTQWKGRHVGTFGDAAFFSFGRDKVISSVFGGAVATNDSVLAERLQRFYEAQARPAGLGWIFQQILHPVLMGIGKGTYRFFVGKIFLAVASRLKILSRAVYPQERMGGKPPFLGKRLPGALAELALWQFGKLEQMNKHRLGMARLYHEELSQLGLGASEAGSAVKLMAFDERQVMVHLRYTFFTERRDELLAAAKRDDIVLGDWYTRAIAPEGVDYEKIGYDPADCPCAERLAAQTVNLPTHVNVTREDALRIVSFLKKFYGV